MASLETTQASLSWKQKLQDLHTDVDKKVKSNGSINTSEKNEVVKSTREILVDMKKEIGSDVSSPYYTQLKKLLEIVKNNYKPDPILEGENNQTMGPTEPEKGKEENGVVRNSIGTELERKTLNMLKKMSPNARITYQRMVGRARDQDCNFIVADKPYGKCYCFNQFGTYFASFPMLFGRQAGDEIPESAWGKDPDSLAEDEKISPAGIFILSSIYYDTSLDEDLLSVDEDWDGDGLADSFDGVALHPLYLGNPGEKRRERIATKSGDDNKISYGCLNITQEDFDEWMRTCFGTGGLIAITPDNKSLIDTYIPPYKPDVANIAKVD